MKRRLGAQKKNKNSSKERNSFLKHPLVVAFFSVVVFGIIGKTCEFPQRSEIINLADKSMWSWHAKEKVGGDSGSYAELLRMPKQPWARINPSLVDFVDDQIERVRTDYRNIDIILSFPALLSGPVQPGLFLYDLQLPTKDLIGYAKSENQKWFTNAKAAYLLRFRAEKQVPSALIDILSKSKTLLVRKAALDSFCAITKLKISNSLDFDGAKKFWESPKRDSITKNLNEDDTVPLKKAIPLTLEEINKKFDGRIIELPL